MHQTSTTIGNWHVYYDDEPQVIDHICAVHRFMGQILGCDTSVNLDRPYGDCDHVQMRPCDCSQRVECGACRDGA